MATKINQLMIQTLFVTLINLLVLTTADDACPYPCIPPPITGTTTPTAPPATQTVSSYPPPAYYTPSAGNLPYYPPGASAESGSSSQTTAPSPPDPILPYFPYYYRNGARQKPSDQTSSSSSFHGSRVQIGLSVVNTAAVVISLFF